MGSTQRAQAGTAVVYEGQPVAEDPQRDPHEKETVIGFSKADDKFTIESFDRTFVRWLLRHPEFELARLHLVDGKVVGVCGKLPIGCLRLLGRGRKLRRHSRCLGKLPAESGGKVG